MALWMKGIELRRAFFKKYLESMGDDASDENVDNVILEAEFFTVVRFMYNQASFEELHRSDNPRYNYHIFEKTKELFEEAKTNKKLKNELLEGVLLCKRY